MTTSDQQAQTQKYFSAHADEWRQKADTGLGDVNVIRQRNGYVLNWLGRLDNPTDFLDLGCGTGELAIDASRLGVRGVGLDFAPEMIDLANAKAKEEGADKAEFRVGSILEADFEDASFDVISGQGLIEYLSLEETKGMIAKSFQWLKPGGVLVLGSRNRLYNIVSFNNYTQAEMNYGTTERLMNESIALSACATAEDAAVALADVNDDLPAFEEHGKTGIDVRTRHQYTPAEMIRMTAEGGLQTVGLSPVHYHPMPPALKAQFKPAHIDISETLHDPMLDCVAAIPVSSSFMIAARK